jgi:hypothetical protein
MDFAIIPLPQGTQEEQSFPPDILSKVSCEDDVYHRFRCL